MGLTIAFGLLADLVENDTEGAEWLRESFAAINQVLEEIGMPRHDEPEQLPTLHHRAAIDSFPYSYMHYLRRFYAHATSDPDWIPCPTPADEDPADDPVLEEETYMMSSHLLCHSDAEGFYLPVEFSEVIVDEQDAGRIPGGLLGSSVALRNELVEITAKLGIEMTGNELSDAEADRVNREVANEVGFWIEKMVWLALYEAARLSIEHKTAICFT